MKTAFQASGNKLGKAAVAAFRTRETPLSPFACRANELIRLSSREGWTKVEAWIRDGRSLAVPREVRTTPLGVGVGHRIPQPHRAALAPRGEPAGQERRAPDVRCCWTTLRWSNWRSRTAPRSRRCRFLDVLLTGNRALVASFLERGADHHHRPSVRTRLSISCVPRRPSGRICDSAAADLTSQSACSGRWTWRCGSSPMREI